MNGLVECTLVRCGGLLKYYKFTITTIKKMYVVTTATLNKLELLQLMANQLELYGITCVGSIVISFQCNLLNFFLKKKTKNHFALVLKFKDCKNNKNVNQLFQFVKKKYRKMVLDYKQKLQNFSFFYIP